MNLKTLNGLTKNAIENKVQDQTKHSLIRLIRLSCEHCTDDYRATKLISKHILIWAALDSQKCKWSGLSDQKIHRPGTSR